MKNFLKAAVTIGACLFGIIGITPANASLVVNGTRFVYNADDKEIVVKLNNVGSIPSLAQAWLDTGDAKSTPSSVDTPFVISPPLARIDPGKSQTLRIFYTREPLTQDKESLFWLNVLEVGPKPTGEAADSNLLQLAFRSRFKFFFRPAGLKGDPADAAGKATWRVVTGGDGKAIEAHNPTPYYITFTKLEVTAGDASHANPAEDGMVAPGETKTFALKDALDATASKLGVRFDVVNDYGGVTSGEAALEPARASK